MNLALSSMEQGLIYAVLAMGVYITFKVLNIADMSVEGSFPFGALVCARLLSLGVHPLLATGIAMLSGMLPGLVSASIAIKLKVNALLAGILTMTMFYSINLKVNHKPNVPLAGGGNIFSFLHTGHAYVNRILVLAGIVLFIKVIIDWFFTSKLGYMLIVTGDNESLVTSLGKDANKYKMIGWMMANALVALSGALFAQSIKFADIQMGIGILIISLASLIIGDTLFRNTNFKGTTKAIFGAIIYKIIGAFALEVGLEANDLKLVNGLIVILFLAYNHSYAAIRSKLVK